MHDLATIDRRNNAAIEQHVTRTRAGGLYVVEIRAGLDIVEYLSFRDPILAERRAAELRLREGPAMQVKVLAPLTEAEAAVVLRRDQSEDRQ